MVVNVIGLDFPLTDAISCRAESRLRSALRLANERVSRAVAFLGDINGDHGGVDKSCRIVAHIQKLGTVVVREVDRDLYAAMDRATGKLRQVIARKLGRRRTLSRLSAADRPGAAGEP
jgi:ribosome-associated translation inhibitor RaiA